MTEQEQLAAVQNYGRAIAHIKNPGEAIQLAAVQQDGQFDILKIPAKLFNLPQYSGLAGRLNI